MSAREVVFEEPLRCVRVSSLPGDVVLRLLRAATDVDGHEWPAGTEFRPLCAGHDNERGVDYRRVAVRS